MRRLLIAGAASAVLALVGCQDSDNVTRIADGESESREIVIAGTGYRLVEISLPNGELVHCLQSSAAYGDTLTCWRV